MRTQTIHQLSFRRQNRAFTLVEILAALVIFSVAVLALLVSMNQSLAMQSGLRMRERAAMLAENIIEEIRYANDLTVGEAEGIMPAPDSAFDWWSGISETEIPGLMKVAVIISWKDGKVQDYRLETLMME